MSTSLQQAIVPADLPPSTIQLLSPEAEKYLREGGKIEDYPEPDQEKEEEKK